MGDGPDRRDAGGPHAPCAPPGRRVPWAPPLARAALRFGRRHLLVVQGASTGSAPRIRGVLSLTQLERQLGHPIDATEVARSFAEIQRALS